MRTHIKAFTYEPKIPDVLAGACTQTIRPKASKRMEIGDIILFHGWEGRPYISKWSWRLRVEVTFLQEIWMWSEGFSIDVYGDIFCPWNSSYCDELAEKDYIKPRTGKAMGELFNSMYDFDGVTPQLFEIIRWKPLKTNIE